MKYDQKIIEINKEIHENQEKVTTLIIIIILICILS